MKALILNGSPEPNPTADAVRDILLDELRTYGLETREFVLRDEKIAYCTGCFGCWIKTPGECVIDDAGREVTKAIMESDLVVYLTPVTFGGYSSELKKALDRMIPMLSPFFTKIGGEIHHQERYDRYPGMMAVGILAEPNDESARLFETLHSRNAINGNAPGSAAGTVVAGCEVDDIRTVVEALFSKTGVAQ